MDIEKLKADDFEKLLFEGFHVKRPSHDVPGEVDTVVGAAGTECVEPEIELIEVDRHHRLRKLEGGFGQRKREPFTLLFRGSHDNVFISHIHTIVHEKLGPLEVFLNPVHADPVHQLESHPQGRFYEVYFN